MGPDLLVEQVDVKLSAGNHGYPELGAELVVQLAQRAHEQLPVRRNRLVARLCWRVGPQSCAKVMLGCCAAHGTRSEAGHDLLRPFQAMRQQNGLLAGIVPLPEQPAVVSQQARHRGCRSCDVSTAAWRLITYADRLQQTWRPVCAKLWCGSPPLAGDCIKVCVCLETSQD